nr:DUF2871 domain-containing protein [uncultured Cellulosilyticum sp.]
MKKVINMAFIYAILGLIGGVYYRELTRFFEFSGKTQLGTVHTHLFVLGMIMLLLIGLYGEKLNLFETKRFKVFYVLYNVGVLMSTVMMVIRGTLQVIGTQVSRAVDMSISGISGIAHIILGIGFVLFFMLLKKHCKN